MRVRKELGLGELGGELGRLQEAISRSASSILELEGVVDSARAFCPVDTGALASSIRAERRGPTDAALVAGGGGLINPRTGRPVDYAVAVHDGTSGQPPRPFLEQALYEQRMVLAEEMARRTAEAL
jgi:HK97 gp10 family phage protein